MMDKLNQLRLEIDRRSDKISEAEQTIEENLENLEYYQEDASEASKNLEDHISKQEQAKNHYKTLKMHSIKQKKTKMMLKH